MTKLPVETLARLRAQGRIPAAGKPAKSPKYKNRKTEAEGLIFDSAKEAKRYQELKLLERAGEITGLQTQIVFVLCPAVMLDGRKKPAIRYVADFSYRENGILVAEDVKSEATRKMAVYRLKKHLMKHVHGIEIRET